MFLRTKTMKSTENYFKQIERLKNVLDISDAVIIGAGAGLSTSAGFTYSGERFDKYFSDFKNKYGFTDMYYGGFYPYKSPEEYWAYWSRYVYINRYEPAKSTVYTDLLELIKEKDYFVITTNVDHQFQKSGFDKHRLFYTQGDYGLFQCSVPCHNKTYNNEDIIKQMMKEQKNMRIPTDLIPYCPKCGKPMTMNLRSDNRFVEDDGWHIAAERYSNFIRRHKNMKVLFFELGIGENTPVIIKYTFWNMTYENPNAVYACVNLKNYIYPNEIKKQSICINSDIRKVILDLKHS